MTVGETSGQLIFTFSGSNLFYNNQNMVKLKATNIHSSYGAFRPEVYWSAKILDFDQNTRTLRASITNYRATKEEFIHSQTISFPFSRISFSDIDISALQTCLEKKEQSASSTVQSSFFGSEIHNNEKKAELDELKSFRLKDEVLKSLGALKEQQICDVRIDEFRIKNNSLEFDFISAGQKKAVCFDYIHVPESLSMEVFIAEFEIPFIETIKIDVRVYEHGICPISRHFERLCFRLGCDVSSPIALPSKQSLKPETQSLPASRSTSREPRHQPSPPQPVWVKENPSNVTIKIADLTFQNGSVSFEFRCPHTQCTLTAIVENSAIKSSFEYIQGYLCNLIGKKRIVVTLTLEVLRSQGGRALDSRCVTATSADLDLVTPETVVEIKGRYFVDLMKPKKNDRMELTSINEELNKVFPETGTLAPSELIELVIEHKPKAHHALQLRFLAGRHLVKQQPLKMGGSPHSFLFLLKGKNGLFFVLETLHSKLATYVWTCPEEQPVILEKAAEIENLMKAFEDKNRQSYRASNPPGFQAIEHDNLNQEEGYQEWLRQIMSILDDMEATVSI